MTGFTAKLDFQSRVPLYEQLYRLIAAEIQNGHIAEDETLPSKRNLCACLGVSLSTVETAYGLLMAEGYIRSIPRSGYRACHVAQLEAKPKPPDPVLSSSPPLSPGCQYSFSTSDVDTSVFPYASWAKITKEVVYQNPELLQRGPCQGDESLRSSLCNFLRQYRGVSATPEQLIIGAGVEYLLDLLLQLIEPQHTIALENPGYHTTYRTVVNNGRHFKMIPVDEKGMCLDVLTESNADVAYVTPSHQFPMGVTMPVGRRMELLQWADRRPDRYIIEDDYDSEFRYTSRPIPAMQGLDKNGRVIYIGTFSRSIAPSIRIAYLVLPPALLAQYRQRFWYSSSTVSRFEQQVLRRFIDQGLYSRHLRRVGNLYRHKVSAILQILGGMKNASIQGLEAGLHFLLTVKGQSEDTLIRLAKETDVRVHGLSEYYHGDGCPPSTLVLGYAGLEEDALTEAALRLRTAYENL